MLGRARSSLHSTLRAMLLSSGEKSFLVSLDSSHSRHLTEPSKPQAQCFTAVLPYPDSAVAALGFFSTNNRSFFY